MFYYSVKQIYHLTVNKDSHDYVVVLHTHIVKGSSAKNREINKVCTKNHIHEKQYYLHRLAATIVENNTSD